MSGLFISSIEDRRLEYYFNEVASGREDSRRILADHEVDFFGAWSNMATSSQTLLEIYREIKDLKGDARFRRSVKNVGYDLCFSAPKQVSVLFGLLQPEISDAILWAHKSSVENVLSSLESKLTWGKGASLDAVGFVHQNSRALDPHLHTHLIIANRCEVGPGMLRAINSNDLYAQVSREYRMNLAREIYSRIGVVMIEREMGANGGPTQIPNFPQEIASLFSKRSVEISHLASRWQTDARGALRAASLVTRPAKVTLDDDVLRARWREDLASQGYSVDQLSKLVSLNRSLRKISAPTRCLPPASNVANMLLRFENPPRAQGWLKVITYRDDLFERMTAFSKGRTVAIISASKKITPVLRPNLLFDETLIEPVEVIVLGKVDLDALAGVLNRYLHQDVFVALPAKEANSSLLRSFIDHGGRVNDGGQSVGEARRLGDSSLSFDGFSLRETLNCIANESASFGLDSSMPHKVILGSKKDRDLARRYVADRLGVEVCSDGFHQGEAVRVNYPPKRYSLAGPEIGVVSLEEGVVRLRHRNAKIEILLSELNLNTMLSPLAILGRSEARRTLPSHLVTDVSLGSFALYDTETEMVTHYDGARSRHDDLSREREVVSHLSDRYKLPHLDNAALGIGRQVGI